MTVADYPEGDTVPLDTNNIKAGGPDTNWIDVGILANTTLPTDSFVRIASYTGSGNSPAPVNESNLNVGVTNANLDGGESLEIKVVTSENSPANGDEGLYDMAAIDIGTKTPKAALYKFELYDGVTKVFDTDDYRGETVGSGADSITINANGAISIGKNGMITLKDYVGGILFDTAIVTSVNGDAVKVGLNDLSIYLAPSDQLLGFDIALSDMDGDVTPAVHFDAFIDGNQDETYTGPSALMANNPPADLLLV